MVILYISQIYAVVIQYRLGRSAARKARKAAEASIPELREREIIGGLFDSLKQFGCDCESGSKEFGRKIDTTTEDYSGYGSEGKDAPETPVEY